MQWKVLRVRLEQSRDHAAARKGALHAAVLHPKAAPLATKPFVNKHISSVDSVLPKIYLYTSGGIFIPTVKTPEKKGGKNYTSIHYNTIVYYTLKDPRLHSVSWNMLTCAMRMMLCT